MESLHIYKNNEIEQQKLRLLYNPDGSKLRNHQLMLLQLLDYFDLICKKNHIKYFLSSGTCLGAIRHRGFIPWDDDIDVEMTRDEYLKFEKVFQENDKFALQTYDNDLFYTEPFSKLRMKDVEVSEGDFDKRYKYRGPFMDIFIMEPIPYFPAVFCHFLVGLMRHFSFHINESKWQVGMYKLWKSMNARVINLTRKLFAKENSNVLRHTCGTGCEKNIRMRNELFPSKIAEFEGKSYPVPGNVDQYLRRLYGDYMTIPKKIQTHDIIG